MVEYLTTSDVGTIIGWLAGAFGIGFIAGRIQRVYVQLSEKL
jgi:hypothetical protein